jgi:hypothetical protein
MKKAQYIEKDVGENSLVKINIDEVSARWKRNLLGEFRALALLARCLLAIRSSEAAAERAFSHAAVWGYNLTYKPSLLHTLFIHLIMLFWYMRAPQRSSFRLSHNHHFTSTLFQ